MMPDHLQSIQSKIDSKELTIVSLVDQYLTNIESTHDLNLYIEVYNDEALQKAKALDLKIQAGEKVGSLYGCIFSIKDNIVQEGKKATAASKILNNYESPFTATAIQRLLDEDAIVIGRTNCDEFGMGSANENSIYGPTKNGVDPERTPGGSSGGAAVSVQMNTCLIAIGSDTGGSIRQPAAFCGVYGLKPTYGRISRYGLIAYASSFDQIGIIGNHPDDIGAVLRTMAGKDNLDATSSSKQVLHTMPDLSMEQLSIATFPEISNHAKLSESVSSALNSKIEQIESKGGKIKEFKLKYLDYWVPTYYVLTTAEASTNLSRYDGVRYGHRSLKSEDLEEMYLNTRTEGFGKEVKRRIMLGTYVLSEGYYDAYFTKAQQIRRLIKEEIDSILEEVDFLMLPTTTGIPWKIGTHSEDPVEVYLSDIFTVLANLTGLPSINIPVGTNSDGIPLGIQIITKRYDENKLLALCKGL